MKNYTNIFDIDGNLIRKAGDNHKFTLEEVEQLVDNLHKKVEENPENEAYKVYLNNAQKYLFSMYNNIGREDLMKRMTILQDTINAAKTEETTEEQAVLNAVNEEIEKLKDSIDNVEPENPTIMDEYVQFEEIK